ncbi:hypothetical protein GJ633_06985 [Halorubrum sp. CBA1125]|jgi:hypothetical protein|uniref:hypothetical protein n=1 Tax=Halorubrum sp. CBA1125 TaxID=2668072 RepID=UPI0012E70E7E|nr:hypothetical protein [Halorubrum sp. CBA1125]MUW14439.1 hypothetical protein [Halorubrum sp. CBA1125]
MVSLTLVSTVLMGLLVVGTFLAVARIGTQRSAPGRDGPPDRYAAIVEAGRNVAQEPTVWAVAFIVITVGLGAVTLLAVGNFGLPEGLPNTLLTVVFAVVALLVVGFIFLGAYFGARGRGLGNAHGVAAGSFAVGLAFLVLIVAQLVVGVLG